MMSKRNIVMELIDYVDNVRGEEIKDKQWITLKAIAVEAYEQKIDVKEAKSKIYKILE